MDGSREVASVDERERERDVRVWEVCLVTGRGGDGGWFFSLKCTGDSTDSLDEVPKLKDGGPSCSVWLGDAVGDVCGPTIG